MVRLRTMSPLRLIDKSGQRHDMTAQLALLGELVLPERCLCKLQGIEWQGQQIVTVENKGPSWITRCKQGSCCFMCLAAIPDWRGK